MSLSLSRLLGGGGTPIGGVIQMSSAVPGPVVEIDGQTYLKGGSYILDGEAEYPEAFARMTPSLGNAVISEFSPPANYVISSITVFGEDDAAHFSFYVPSGSSATDIKYSNIMCKNFTVSLPASYRFYTVASVGIGAMVYMTDRDYNNNTVFIGVQYITYDGLVNVKRTTDTPIPSRGFTFKNNVFGIFSGGVLQSLPVSEFRKPTGEVTWTNTSKYTSVYAKNDTMLLMGYSNTLTTSTDGVVFTSVTTPATISSIVFCESDGYFYILAGGLVYKTLDGATITPVTISGVTTFTLLMESNGEPILSVTNGDNYVFRGGVWGINPQWPNTNGFNVTRNTHPINLYKSTTDRYQVILSSGVPQSVSDVDITSPLSPAPFTKNGYAFYNLKRLAPTISRFGLLHLNSIGVKAETVATGQESFLRIK